MRSGAQGSAGAAAGASGRLLQSTLYHVPLKKLALTTQARWLSPAGCDAALASDALSDAASAY